MNLQEAFGKAPGKAALAPHGCPRQVPNSQLATSRNLAPAQPQHGRFAPRSAVATNCRQRMPGTAINLGTFAVLQGRGFCVISLKYV